MRMDPTIKRRERPSGIGQGWLIAIGITALTVAFVILGLSLWESFGGLGRVREVTLPGFHRLPLRDPGLYAGFYQHRSTGPVPASQLARMNVRVLSREFEEVPVLMNTTAQVVDRFGVQGMPLFNFVVREAGDYTLSGAYVGADSGPDVPVLIIPQAVQNVRATLAVGLLFFLLFVAIAVLVLRRAARASPPPA